MEVGSVSPEPVPVTTKLSPVPLGHGSVEEVVTSGGLMAALGKLFLCLGQEEFGYKD